MLTRDFLMNLEKIQEMWEADSKIDIDNLHDESIRIPQLHQKYYTLYTTIKLLRTKCLDTLNKTRLERYNYYSGKAPAEVGCTSDLFSGFGLPRIWIAFSGG